MPDKICYCPLVVAAGDDACHFEDAGRGICRTCGNVGNSKHIAVVVIVTNANKTPSFGTGKSYGFRDGRSFSRALFQYL